MKTLSRSEVETLGFLSSLFWHGAHGGETRYSEPAMQAEYEREEIERLKNQSILKGDNHAQKLDS